MTCSDPSSLVLRRETPFRNQGMVAPQVVPSVCSGVRGVDSGVSFAPVRCFTVCGSERQRLRGMGGRWMESSPGTFDLVVCEESMDEEKAARWVISNRKVSR